MSLNTTNTKLALLGEDGKFYAVIKMGEENVGRSLEAANSNLMLSSAQVMKGHNYYTMLFGVKCNASVNFLSQLRNLRTTLFEMCLILSITSRYSSRRIRVNTINFKIKQDFFIKRILI